MSVLNLLKLLGAAIDTGVADLESLGPAASTKVAQQLKALGYINSATATEIENNSWVGWAGFGIGLLAVAALSTPVGAASEAIGVAATSTAGAAIEELFAGTAFPLVGQFAASGVVSATQLMIAVATATINFVVAEGATALTDLAAAAGGALGDYAKKLLQSAPSVYNGTAVVTSVGIPTNVQVWNAPAGSLSYTEYTPQFLATSAIVQISSSAVTGDVFATVSQPSGMSLGLDFGDPSFPESDFVIINGGKVDPPITSPPYINEAADGSLIVGLPDAAGDQSVIVEENPDNSINLMVGANGSDTGTQILSFAADDFDGDVIDITNPTTTTTDVATEIASGDTFEVSEDLSSSSIMQDFSFSATGGGTLLIDNANNFTGTISNFRSGDTIDLAGISATGGTFGASNALTVQESDGSTLSLNVAAPTGSTTAYAIPDGSGGTGLVLTEPVPVTTSPSSEMMVSGVPLELTGLSVAIPGDASVNEMLTVVLSDGSGLLSAQQVTGGAVGGSGTQQLTLTGTPGAINTELASVTYTGAVATLNDIVNVVTSNDQGGGDDNKINITVSDPASLELPDNVQNVFASGVVTSGDEYLFATNQMADLTGMPFSIQMTLIVRQGDYTDGAYGYELPYFDVSGKATVGGLSFAITPTKNGGEYGATGNIVTGTPYYAVTIGQDLLDDGFVDDMDPIYSLPQNALMYATMVNSIEISMGSFLGLQSGAFQNVQRTFDAGSTPVVASISQRLLYPYSFSDVLLNVQGAVTDLSLTSWSGANVPQCLSAGTCVAARHGETPVEQLVVGDILHAQFGGLTPIKWIGYRHVYCSRHPDPRQVWPVRVRADAFANNSPHRDLWLSPDHAVYVNDVLIPIRHLINGMTIEQVPKDEVTYYHVELDQHDVLFAEGLPAESYLDTGDRSNFANGGGPMRLHPDFSARMWEAKGCAPLIVTGPILATVRARLLQRAAKLAVKPRSRTKTARAA